MNNRFTHVNEKSHSWKSDIPGEWDPLYTGPIEIPQKDELSGFLVSSKGLSEINAECTRPVH